MHAVKLIVYGGAAVLTVDAIGQGLAIGLIMIAGTYLGKRLLDRIACSPISAAGRSRACGQRAATAACGLGRGSLVRRLRCLAHGGALEPYTLV